MPGSWVGGGHLTRSLEGRPVAEALIAAARAAVEAGVARGRPRPGLASVHRGAQTPFAVYLRQQSRAAERVGIAFRTVPLREGAAAPELKATVRALDADPAVHAVLVEHPLPAALDFLGAVGALRPEKDVDGVGAENLGRLVARHPIHAPAVARAALAIADHYRIPLGRRVAVVGRSETVGLPLALLLLDRSRERDATVTVAHSRTPDLGAALAGCEVVFSCAGAPGLLTRTVVPEGAAVIDIGLSTRPDPQRPGGIRISGDADAASLDGWASALTPVPGGVGPVTVARLMANAVAGWERLTGGPE